MINKGIKTRDQIFIEKGLNPEDVSSIRCRRLSSGCKIEAWKLTFFCSLLKFKVKKEEVAEDARDDRLDALESANLEELDELEVLHHYTSDKFVIVLLQYHWFYFRFPHHSLGWWRVLRW
jgi:hypothetical protein